MTRGACPPGADGDTSWRHLSSLGPPRGRSRQGCHSAPLALGDPPAGPPGGWGRQGCCSARLTRGDPPAGTVPGARARALACSLARFRGTPRILAPGFRPLSSACAYPPTPSCPFPPVPSQVAENGVGKPAIRGGKMIIDQEIFTSAGTLLLGSENTTWKEAQTYCHRRGCARAGVSACVLKCVCQTPRLLAHVVAYRPRSLTTQGSRSRAALPRKGAVSVDQGRESADRRRGSEMDPIAQRFSGMDFPGHRATSSKNCCLEAKTWGKKRESGRA
jgi:hypothetical protein